MSIVECHSCGVQWEEPDESAKLARIREELDKARRHARVLYVFAKQSIDYHDDGTAKDSDESRAADEALKWAEGLP